MNFPFQVEQLYIIDIAREEQDKLVETLHRMIVENKSLSKKIGRFKDEDRSRNYKFIK